MVYRHDHFLVVYGNDLLDDDRLDYFNDLVLRLAPSIAAPCLDRSHGASNGKNKTNNQHFVHV